MMSLDYVKSHIKGLKPYLDEKYSVCDIYIFGSFARGEQTDTSDIDVLVDFRKTPDLLTFIEIEDFISKNLHHKIDLVPKRKLKEQLKEQIMDEAIAI